MSFWNILCDILEHSSSSEDCLLHYEKCEGSERLCDFMIWHFSVLTGQKYQNRKELPIGSIDSFQYYRFVNGRPKLKKKIAESKSRSLSEPSTCLTSANLWFVINLWIWTQFQCFIFGCLDESLYITHLESMYIQLILISFCMCYNFYRSPAYYLMAWQLFIALFAKRLRVSLTMVWCAIGRLRRSIPGRWASMLRLDR